MPHKNTLSTVLAATLLTLGLAGAAVAAESTTTHAQTDADSSAAGKHATTSKHDTASKKTAHMDEDKGHKDSKKTEEAEEDEASDNEQEEAAEDSHKK